MIRSLALLATLPTAFAFEYTAYTSSLCQGDLLDMQSRSLEDSKTACDANPECNAVSCAAGQTANCQLRSNESTTDDYQYDCYLQTSNRTSPLGKELCVRMTVQPSNHQQGYLSYSFKNNGTMVINNSSQKFYNQGEVIVDTCLPGGVDSLTVQNTANDGIGFLYEFSTDGGASWDGAYLDCAINKNKVSVDGDGTNREGCFCQEGEPCEWNIVRKDRVDTTKTKCVKATIADYDYAAGYFSISMLFGSNVVGSRASERYKRGTVAVHQCYDYLTEVKMSTDNSDAAFVDLEFSQDGGANWDSEISCENCGGTQCTSSPGGLFLVFDNEAQELDTYSKDFPEKPEGFCHCLNTECTIATTASHGTIDCTGATAVQVQHYYETIDNRLHMDFVAGDGSRQVVFSAKGADGVNIVLANKASFAGTLNETGLIDLFVGGSNEPFVHFADCLGCSPLHIVNEQLMSDDSFDKYVIFTLTEANGDTTLKVSKSTFTEVEDYKYNNGADGSIEVASFTLSGVTGLNQAVFTYGYGDLECSNV